MHGSAVVLTEMTRASRTTVGDFFFGENDEEDEEGYAERDGCGMLAAEVEDVGHFVLDAVGSGVCDGFFGHCNGNGSGSRKDVIGGFLFVFEPLSVFVLIC